MEEKQVKKFTDNQFKKERFSFELRINDNIVCQRYFRINGFKSKSLVSKQLTDTLRYCAKLIQDDLKDKTNLFNEYTAPQIFRNEDEMNKWLPANAWRLEVPTYIILEDSEQNFVWDGESVKPYDKYINRNDYVTNKDNAEVAPCLLKLAFLDNEKEVCSTSWDGNVYPRFIRTNIDLSNSKNKYKADGVFAPFEACMVNIMNETHVDLIPIIVKEFCVTCSYEDDKDYITSDSYGGVKYGFNVMDDWHKYVAAEEKRCRKKTERYFA